MSTTMTAFLAIWGAVVSTIAIMWNIRRDLTDRGRLRVLCYLGKVVGEIPPDHRRHLVYNVTNVGHRAVVVTHVGGAIRKDRHFMIDTHGPMPRTLQPGEYFLEYSHDLSILDDNPEALWAIDSMGNNWKISRKALRHLLTNYRSAENNENNGRGDRGDR
jgi:hypothetical protein